MIIRNEKMYQDNINLLSNTNVIFFNFDNIINCIYDYTNKNIYTICNNNIEYSVDFNIKDYKFNSILYYKYNKSSKNNTYDLNTYLFYYYNKTINIDDDLYVHMSFYNDYFYNLIPPSIIEDIVLKHVNDINFVDIDSNFIQYNNIVNDVCGYINSVGIFYNKEIIYSKLEYYNLTGRPSNKSHNINWMGLSKDGNARELITSRFDDGVLIQFDYNSFHMKIVSDLIDYEYDYNDNIHYKLGMEYFSKDILTDEEYSIAKNTNFKMLYGDTYNKFNSVFIDKLDIFVNELYKKLVKYGYIETYFFKRKIYFEYISNPNPKKVFNYYVQAFESEYNLLIMNNILKLLENYNTKLILYTYDSFLFDYDKSDGEELFNEINEIISHIYSCEISYGDNYKELIVF